MNQEFITKTYEDMKQECAPVFYKEIEKFFAKGMLVLVAEGLDIIDVALIIQNDETTRLNELINQGKVVRVHDDHAIKWSKANEALMAITAVPWVLVQEIN